MRNTDATLKCLPGSDAMTWKAKALTRETSTYRVMTAKRNCLCGLEPTAKLHFC